MDQNQQELRRIANQVFMQSLNQLEETLQSAGENPSDSIANSSTAASNKPASLDLQALEAAAADIEQSLQTLQPDPDASCKE